ncbi:hypothetical protein LEP1GSC188_0367 [Leptospira weilii serovar Topaz str. LT2116]|uniref:Uncharacterized protein n=1 Tax=Leptospira weilii serovar Topaz str. LT2116 TaxID=1088540 RepID=M3H671_9LEPT|nr:hypothetical protein LEP1GSC188_0367 [Leptospira weilii serovar Topaz str. LT2116]
METFQKRLKILEAFLAQNNSPVLIESQVQALERRKLEKQIEDEIETKISGTWDVNILITWAQSKV